jgi:L-ascorbate metabolism protein UlaG (beta-lactamase superfamily)
VAVGAVAGAYLPRIWSRALPDISRPIAPAPHRPDPSKWSQVGLHAAWIGHATVLLKIDGFTILTDPIFSDRAGVSVGPLTFGPKRLVAPALAVSELPAIDLVLLSHAHMDHCDIPSLERLAGDPVTVVAATKMADLVPHGFRVVRELDWNRATTVGPLTIRAFAVEHWGRRLRSEDGYGYNGYVIESGRHRLVFSGDTAFTPAFATLRGSRPADLAIMPIGCYDPWIRNHCTPEQAWQMAQDAGAERLLPIHHQTFRLSREPVDEPIQRLEKAAGGQDDRIVLRRIGEEFHLA